MPQTAARRALAMSVPALGLVGAAGALAAGHEPTAESEPIGDIAPVAGTAGSPVVDGAGAEPAVVTVAADAARAAGQAGEQQRVQERRSIEAVVHDVRADARDREAAAAAQGQEALEEFHRDAARQQETRPTAPADGSASDTGRDNSAGSTPDHSENHCDTTGLPLIGDRADGHEIVGRDCGLTDLFGRQRSTDPWIDGQLLSDDGQ